MAIVTMEDNRNLSAICQIVQFLVTITVRE